jgi:hypothetical protein
MLGPHRHDGARGLHKVVVAGQHARFGVVDEQNVEAFEHFEQRRLVILDPVIHGVAGDQLHAGHGLAHAALQHGIDVGEEEKLRVAIGVGNLGLEGRKDVQLGLVGLGLVQVFEIRALPEEALAGARSMPRVSMLRFLKTASCSGPKSSPTTAMTRTSVKKLAASEK